MVLGSGSSSKIDAKGFDGVFCANTSFTRLNSGSDFFLVTSDAFLFDEEMLNSLPPISGLTHKESNKIRLKNIQNIRIYRQKKFSFLMDLLS